MNHRAEIVHSKNEFCEILPYRITCFVDFSIFLIPFFSVQMSEFTKEEALENVEGENINEISHEKAEGNPSVHLIDASKPNQVLYCGVCSMPPEFCEYGSCFDKCLPWIVEHCPEVLPEEVLAQAIGKLSTEDGEKGGDEVEEVGRFLVSDIMTYLFFVYSLYFIDFLYFTASVCLL
jgi:hypothetical protein